MIDASGFTQRLKRVFIDKSGDEKEVLEVLNATSNEDRLGINYKFSELYNAPLVCELHQRFSGDFAELAACLFEGRYYTWARWVHQAIKGAGTDEDALYHAVLLMNTDDYIKVSLVYEQAFGRNMYSDISEDVSGDFKRLLLAWLRNQPNCVADPEKLAHDIRKAAKGAGTDEDVFVAIIVNSSPECYSQTCLKYYELFSKTIEEEIRSEFSSFLYKALILASKVKQSRPDAIAWLLYKSMKGLGTDENMLTMLTVLFSPIYAGNQIADGFAYYGDLQKWIAGDTSGSYEKALKMLWTAK